MKHLFAFFMSLMLCVPVMADDYEYLTFQKLNGMQSSIKAVGTVITYADGKLNAVNGDEHQVITVADMAKMFFSNNASFLMGDVNDDGEISVVDVTLLVSRALGNLDPETTVFIEERADLDGDGEVSIADVMALVELILGTP